MGKEIEPHTPQLADFETERLPNFRGARIIVKTVEGPRYVPGEIPDEDEADRLLGPRKAVATNLRPLGHLTLAEYYDGPFQN